MSVKLRLTELFERSWSSASPGLMGVKVALVVFGGSMEESGSLAKIVLSVRVKIAIHC